MKQNSGKILFLGGPAHGRVHKVPKDDRHLYPEVKVPVLPERPPLYTSLDKVGPPYPDYLMRTTTYRLHRVRRTRMDENDRRMHEYRFYVAEDHHADDWLDLLLSLAEQNSEKCLTR